MGWDIVQYREFYNRLTGEWETLETVESVTLPKIKKTDALMVEYSNIRNPARLPLPYDTRCYGLFAILNGIRCGHLNIPTDKVYTPNFMGLPKDIDPTTYQIITEHGAEDVDTFSYATLKELREFKEKTQFFWEKFGRYHSVNNYWESVSALMVFIQWLEMHNSFRHEMSMQFTKELGESYTIQPEEYRIIWGYNV